VTPRALLRELASRVLGDRPAPVGGVARDRRLLRRALRRADVGRVLVVGPGLALRQALPGAQIDVAGTSPHSAEVTVCSVAIGRGSLPARRWDTVVVTEPGADLRARLEAVREACRPGGRLLVLDRDGLDPALLQTVAVPSGVVGSGRLLVWLGEVRG